MRFATAHRLEIAHDRYSRSQILTNLTADGPGPHSLELDTSNA